MAAVTPLSTNNKYLESRVHICQMRGPVSLYTVVNVSELPSVIATEARAANFSAVKLEEENWSEKYVITATCWSAELLHQWQDKNRATGVSAAFHLYDFCVQKHNKLL